MAQYQQYTQSSHVVVSTSGSDINPVYMCCCPPCAIAEVEGCSPMALACTVGCFFWPWNGLAALFYVPQPPGQQNPQNSVIVVHEYRQEAPILHYQPQHTYGTGAPPQYVTSAYGQPVVGQPVDQTAHSQQPNTWSTGQPPMPPVANMGGQPMGGPPPMGCEPAMQAPMGADSDVKPL